MKKFRVSTTITLSSTSYSLAQGTNKPGALKLKKDTSLTNRFLLRRRDGSRGFLDQSENKPSQQPNILSTNREETVTEPTECREISTLSKKGTEDPSLTAGASRTGIAAGCAPKIDASDERIMAIHKVCRNRYFLLPLRQAFSSPEGNSFVSQRQWWKTPRTFTLGLTDETGWE